MFQSVSRFSGCLAAACLAIFIARPIYAIEDVCTKFYGADYRLDELRAGCSTLSAFCSSLLAGDSFSLASYTYLYKHSTTTATGAATTTTVYSHTITTTLVLIKTIARRIATADQCVSTSKCGLVTLSDDDRVSLRPPCACILGHISTYTYTGHGNPFTQVYNQTVTATTQGHGRDKQAFSTSTVHVATSTAYKCRTIAPALHKCGNKGYQLGAYNVTGDRNFSISKYKGQVPYEIDNEQILGDLYTSENGDYETNYPGFFSTNGEIGFPNGTYLNMRAWLYATQTGNYTFSIVSASNKAWIWFGDVAYRGYNDTNYLIRGYTDSIFDYEPLESQMFLERGKFYPVRLGFLCHHHSPGGACFLWVKISRADGQVEEGADGFHYPYDYYWDVVPYHFEYPQYFAHPVEISNNFLRFGCGRQSRVAPRFPKWIDET